MMMQEVEIVPVLTFKAWFDGHGFYHDHTAREKLEPVWNELREFLEPEEVAGILNEVIYVMKNEYGD